MCCTERETHFSIKHHQRHTHNVNGNGIVVCAAHTIMWEKRRLWTTFSVLIVTKCLLFGDLFRECEKSSASIQVERIVRRGKWSHCWSQQLQFSFMTKWQKCSAFTLVTLISFMHGVEAIYCKHRALTLWVVKTMRECAIDQMQTMQTNSRWTV